jgi:thioredoxin reductase (NADPH)
VTSSFDLLVIGCGVAGLTASEQAAARGLKTACVEALTFGGLIVSVNELDPAPDSNMPSGTEFASSLMEAGSAAGVEFVLDQVTALEKRGSGLVATLGDGSIEARAVIIASGAQLAPLGIRGEAAFQHCGVAHCADCDGPLYSDRDVVVVGGGDSAVQEAIVLSKYCREVFVVHRGDRCIAKPHLTGAASQRPNIRWIANSLACEIRGDEAVTSIVVRDEVSGQTSEIACSGVFPYIGLKPQLDYLKLDLRLSTDGFIITDEKRETGVSNAFAAGIVRSGCGGLLSDAIEDASIATSHAVRALGA